MRNPVKSVKKIVRPAMHSVGLGGLYETITNTALNVADVAYRKLTKPAANVYKGFYDTATLHYQRQQNRLQREQQREAERVQKQQREYAYQQRKAQIDELRERVGAGGTRYRTDRQERKMASSLFGGNGNVETLG